MKILTEYLAEEFLEREKFPVVEHKIFKSKTEAFEYAKKIDFPVVLKIASSKLLHKTEKKAIRLNVGSGEFHKVFDGLNRIKIEKEGIMVQRYVSGKQILIGLKKDYVFGHVVVVGLGGIFTEVIKDVSFRIVPFGFKEASKMLKELKGYSVLIGFRGGEKINIEKVVKLIYRMGLLAKKYPNIRELDLNPVVVNSREALIVDARAVLE